MCVFFFIIFIDILSTTLIGLENGRVMVLEKEKKKGSKEGLEKEIQTREIEFTMSIWQSNSFQGI